MGTDDDQIRRFFDDLADQEWDRLTGSHRGRVSLEVHRRFLSEFVRPAHRVLEIGAGPGRFTIELAQLGASVVVTDVSEVQLGLNRRHVREAGWERAVEDRFLLDVRDTGRFADQEFDLVVAFGGPLSYVFGDAEAALSDLMRVGDVVVASVMSTLGSWRYFLSGILEETRILGPDAMEAVFETGDTRSEGDLVTHHCRMFRWRDVVAMVERCGGDLLVASASNWASMADEALLGTMADDPEHWRRFVEQEIGACREPGALDGGSHILFAARR